MLTRQFSTSDRWADVSVTQVRSQSWAAHVPSQRAQAGSYYWQWYVWNPKSYETRPQSTSNDNELARRSAVMRLPRIFNQCLKTAFFGAPIRNRCRPPSNAVRGNREMLAQNQIFNQNG